MQIPNTNVIAKCGNMQKGRCSILFFFFFGAAENFNTDVGLKAARCCLQDADASGDRAEGLTVSTGPTPAFYDL